MPCTSPSCLATSTCSLCVKSWARSVSIGLQAKPPPSPGAHRACFSFSVRSPSAECGRFQVQIAPERVTRVPRRHGSGDSPNVRQVRLAEVGRELVVEVVRPILANVATCNAHGEDSLESPGVGPMPRVQERAGAPAWAIATARGLSTEQRSHGPRFETWHPRPRHRCAQAAAAPVVRTTHRCINA